MLNLSDKKIDLIVFIILCLFPLSGMGVDLLAPSLPAISHNLHASFTVTKNLIAIYLLGNALGNFFTGFLSDTLGRRKLIICRTLCFAISSMLPVFFLHISALLLARFLQGLSIGAIVVVARAILSDILPSEKLVRIAPTIATRWGIGPVVGPIIGGYLQYYFNWQACFCFYAIFSFIGFIGVTFIISETHFTRQPLDCKQINRNFKTIATHRLFMGVVILMGITYSLLIVFNTLGPFFIQVQLGHSAVYFGHLALGMGIAMIIGTLICRHLLKSFKPQTILAVAIPLLISLSVIGLMLTLLDNKNIWVVIIPSLWLFLSVGIIYPASMGEGLALFRHLAGSGRQ